MIALLRDLAADDREAVLREFDDAELEIGTGTPTPSPADRWRPPAVPRHGAAVACFHGPHLSRVEYAPDAREWRDPATWRRHLGAVAMRLEAVADVDASAHGVVLGEWAAHAEPVSYDAAPPLIRLAGFGRPVGCTLLAVVDGVPEYAPSPVGMAYIRGQR